MQSWGAAYRRLRKQRRFANWFGQKGRVPGPNDFTYQAYTLVFNDVTGRVSDAADEASAPIFGPLTQIFDRGAVILGITSGAYAEQPTDSGTFTAIPLSTNVGRRDLYKLFIQFTDGEKVTPNSTNIAPVVGATQNTIASVSAEALMGEGQKDEFPRDLVVPPSTGFQVRAQSFLPDEASVPNLFIHVVFHAVVPKGL